MSCREKGACHGQNQAPLGATWSRLSRAGMEAGAGPWPGPEQGLITFIKRNPPATERQRRGEGRGSGGEGRRAEAAVNLWSRGWEPGREGEGAGICWQRRRSCFQSRL